MVTPAPKFAPKVPEKAAKPVTRRPRPLHGQACRAGDAAADPHHGLDCLAAGARQHADDPRADQRGDGRRRAGKWFAIQLAVSDQPVNLDAMPRLDIFEAYRLYSVATAGSGKIVHSLRLGFFKEAVSAEAVMGYLKTFFGSPTVMRVSVAEHARFKDAPSAKKPRCAPKSTKRKSSN